MGSIVKIDDLTAEGFDPPGDEDQRLNQLIDVAEATVESLTGFRFYQHGPVTWKLDGSGTDVLTLPQPVITLTSLSEDGVALVADTDFILYNRRLPGLDERRWPRVVKATPIFGSSEAVWNRGRQNIVVVAEKAGFTDLISTTETPPAEIKRVVIRLVRHQLARLGKTEEWAQQRAERFAMQISASDFSVVLGEDAKARGRTGDPIADEVIERYSHVRRSARPAFGFAGA